MLCLVQLSFSSKSQAQSIVESQRFISDMLTDYRPEFYENQCAFGNFGSVEELVGLASTSDGRNKDVSNYVNDSNKHRIMGYTVYWLPKGQPILSRSYFIDLAGVRTIRSRREGNYQLVDIYIKPGYLCNLKTIKNDVTYSSEHSAELLVGLDEENTRRLVRALIHLSRLLGGEPIEDTLFRE